MQTTTTKNGRDKLYSERLTVRTITGEQSSTAETGEHHLSAFCQHQQKAQVHRH